MIDIAVLSRYPDPVCIELRKAIAELHGCDVENVFVGNGSDEVLAHTFLALLKHDRPLLFPEISYSFYPVYCRLYQIEYRAMPLALILETVTLEALASGATPWPLDRF